MENSKPNRLASTLKELLSAGVSIGTPTPPPPAQQNGTYAPQAAPTYTQQPSSPQQAPVNQTPYAPPPPSPSQALLSKYEGEISLLKDGLHQIAMLAGDQVELHRGMAAYHQKQADVAQAMRNVVTEVLERLGQQPIDGGHHANLSTQAGV